MQRTKAIRNIPAIIFLLFIYACTSAPAPESPAETSGEKVSRIFDRIQIGDSKTSVERLLGRPFSYQKTAAGDQAMYMSGMEKMMDQIKDMQRGAQGTSFVSGLLSSVSGLAGLAGPAGGLAAGIGSQVIGAGTSLAAQANQPEMPNMADIEMLIIEYRDGKVTSVQRQSPGLMGMGTEQEELED